MEWSAWGIFRDRAISIAMACSAVVTVLPPGVFMTMTPLELAASRSTLSTPMPARPITFMFFAASMTSAVTLVALRMTIPW